MIKAQCTTPQNDPSPIFTGSQNGKLLDLALALALAMPDIRKDEPR